MLKPKDFDVVYNYGKAQLDLSRLRPEDSASLLCIRPFYSLPLRLVLFSPPSPPLPFPSA
jgi:hypothetical protein